MISPVDDVSVVLSRLRALIGRHGASRKTAAVEIGVSLATLAAHLSEQPRSRPAPKTIALYRRWLALRSDSADASQRLSFARGREGHTPVDGLVLEGGSASRPRRVVDLFSGCGGLSLGFDLCGDGLQFQTVLAMDIEQPMLDVLNDNTVHSGNTAPGRRVDLEEFLSEEEILCFYLDHYERYAPNVRMRLALESLPGGGLGAFRHALAGLDRWFEDQLQSLRQADDYRAAVASVPRDVFTQTAIEAMARSLRLPLLGNRWLHHPILWWAPAADGAAEPQAPSGDGLRRWRSEVGGLAGRARIAGPGSKVHKKLSSFLDFLDTPPLKRLARVWSLWASERRQLRAAFLCQEDMADALRGIYDDHDCRVDVILGGPPCQGFSRVGRGKMRSLNEGGAHVHDSEEAGDSRNLLFRRYVQFVSALAPDLFLFENVASFRSRVQTPDGPFHAVEALEDAFKAISATGVHYAVDKRVIQASEHGLPQRRSRFFMAGVRHGKGGREGALGSALAILTLPTVAESVPLSAALEGLDSARLTDGARGDADLSVSVVVQSVTPEEYLAYREFLASAIGRRGSGCADAHLARRPRDDDAAWFALMAPGTRWMDYRCDDSPLLVSIQAALDRLIEVCEEAAGRRWAPKRARILLASLEELGLAELVPALDSKLAVSLFEAAGRVFPRALGMGPRRYSCGGSQTLGMLQGATAVLRVLCERPDLDRAGLRSTLGGVELLELRALRERVDGSLSIRLLLEAIQVSAEEPGGHHLLRPVYLSKKSGHHGDWMKRLDATKPCRTIVSHMAKDTYPYVHPSEPRMLSVREAARVQTFPDAFSFSKVGLFYGFKMVGNAVPPMLSYQLANQVVAELTVLGRPTRRGRRRGRASVGR